LPKTTKFEQFVVASDDTYASQHAAVSAWVEQSMLMPKPRGLANNIDLKLLPSGKALLAEKPENARRLVRAAVAQVRHWDRLANQLHEEATKTDSAAHYSDHWKPIWGRRVRVDVAIQTLMRRNLPFDKDDLLALLGWSGEAKLLSRHHCPIGPIARALQRYADHHTLDDDLRGAMHNFSRQLQLSHETEARRLATDVERLCLEAQAEPDVPAEILVQPAAAPAPAGSHSVLTDLKQSLGMLPTDAAAATTILAPDAFACPNDSPLLTEHNLLSSVFQEASKSRKSIPEITRKAGRTLGKRAPAAMGLLMLAAAERHFGTRLSGASVPTDNLVVESRYTATQVAMFLMTTEFELDRAGTFDLLLYLSYLPDFQRASVTVLTPKLMANVQRELPKSRLTEGERFILTLFRSSLIAGPPLGNRTAEVAALSTLINDGAMFYLAPGEVWSDAINEEVSRLSADQRGKWADFFRHTVAATAARPSAKWLKTAGQLVTAIGADEICKTFTCWLPLVSKGNSIRKFGRFIGDSRGAADIIQPGNADCLRGLLWCVPLLASRDELLRPVTTVALSAFKKAPGVGPRAPKVGNACVYVLSQLGTKEAVGQLAMLKVRVKSGSAQKEIEKAFEAAAAALGLAREEIEELGVPSYGLEEVGRLVEPLGDYRAEILVTGVDAELNWSDAAGKSLRSVPAKVKSERKEELKDLQQSLKDIKAMLPAQRDRIDDMFLLQKSWPIAQWRERYHDHPLVGTIARRLIWCVEGAPALFENGVATDVHGEPIPHWQTAVITLWHPIGRSIEDVTAWRNRLETLAITQPFKQAYREVYLLTDAERVTRTYSNRFAAHIIRQHQFNALCAARGWKNKLRLMVDATYPPASKSLPNWGLRAEFWTDGIGQDYGVDTNDSGTYLRLATDQVRFYRTAAAANYTQVGGTHYTSEARDPGVDNINEPIPLDEVPPLVFSEIMRDVDLFVGVGSVGNDPTWQDGGPEGRYRDYWHTYSFGELSGTATTRKQVLECLIPRLKIASRCTLSDRFLVVRGDKRTYKIHLGSGNILMEPNDQYLCIVPDARARTTQDGLYLPFDGDAMLSVIISKALLLAADTKIKDLTIVQQIEQR